ncbi:7TM-DISM domain-containing protein, partial [Reinekea sp.]|uniref:7TM-DISM domain-containing protein n=1 Tax=Reinekea sp. TaxID=1970455 RepID=UPI002A83B47A
MNPSILSSLLLGPVLTRLSLALILVVANPVSADNLSAENVSVENVAAFWLADSHFDPSSELIDLLQIDPAQLTARIDPLPSNGGTFWHLMSAEVVAEESLVIDFQSSSVVGLFSHFIIDAQGERIATYSGGLESTELNRYFLRHGRTLAVPPGHYRIYTRMTSPFLLAQPTPNLYAEDPYLKSIKLGNGLTLLGLGIFLALGFYYLTLAFVRNQLADFLYSVFIFGNLIYNATALNVFSDIFGWSIFYSIGFPIMVSNMAYIGFVMRLLDIKRKRTPVLHTMGLIALATLASFWLLVPFMPNHSLEFARYGVPIFALYGLAAAVILSRRGHITARYYLIASTAFIIPAMIAILLQSLPQNTLLIEHLGLLAVAIEVMLLSLVLGHQLNILYREKSTNLFAAQQSLFAADQAIRTKERFLANISH